MIVLRTILFYSLLIFGIRLMGKRQVGQMEPAEFVVTMMLANLAAIPLEELETPVWNGVIPMLLVIFAERVIAWVSLRWIGLRRLFCGKPVVLIDNGKLLYDNLRRTRVNLDELTGHLREKGILAIEQVQFAILETNGALTAFPFPQYRPAEAGEAGITAEPQELPYTIISHGQILWDNLRLSGRDGHWLEGYLLGQRTAAADVLLLTLTPSGKTHLILK